MSDALSPDPRPYYGPGFGPYELHGLDASVSTERPYYGPGFGPNDMSGLPLDPRAEPAP